MNYLQKIVEAFETQNLYEIKRSFENGISPNQLHKGKPLIYELINMYSRGPVFRQCVQIFVDFGLEFEDKILLAILLNDSENLNQFLEANIAAISKKYSLDCTFTPLFEVSLLHICAEYNHLECAKVLIKHGADVNTKAGFDENGFGGQTPIYHTVNQHNNGSIETLKYLISQNADLSISVKGLIWGKGYDWETYIPAVNPISYAMMGLLRQFQRSEHQIYEVVSILMKAQFGLNYFPPNIPNKYLNS